MLELLGSGLVSLWLEMAGVQIQAFRSFRCIGLAK